MTTRCWCRLAAAAGIAADNARLFEESRTREAWIEATRATSERRCWASADPADGVWLIAVRKAPDVDGQQATLVAVPLDDKRRLARSTAWTS